MVGCISVCGPGEGFASARTRKKNLQTMTNDIACEQALVFEPGGRAAKPRDTHTRVNSLAHQSEKSGFFLEHND